MRVKAWASLEISGSVENLNAHSGRQEAALDGRRDARRYISCQHFQSLLLAFARLSFALNAGISIR
jgi:hypothetical protein